MLSEINTAVTASKMIGVYSKLLKYRNEQIRKWCVVFCVKGEMALVSQSTSREKDW